MQATPSVWKWPVPLKPPPHLLAPVSEVQRIHGAIETDLKRTRSGLSEGAQLVR
jgi:hypothetical protein